MPIIQKTQTSNAPTSTICTNNIMCELWERTVDKLERDELEWFALATDQAIQVLTNLYDMVENLGCLVAADFYQEKTSFSQNAKDTSILLFSITQTIDNVRGLLNIGESAMQRLYHPEIYAENTDALLNT